MLGLLNPIKSADLGFLKSSFVYTLFAIASRAVPFLLLPILTQYLDPAAFGRVAMFMTAQMLLMIVVGLSANSVLFQRYSKMPREQLSAFLYASYLLILLAGGLVTLVLFIGQATFEAWAGLPVIWLGVATLCALLSVLQAMGLTLLQMQRQAFSYGGVQFLGATSNALLSVFLVTQLAAGWQGRVLAILISLLLGTAVLLYLQWKNKLLSIQPIGAIQRESRRITGLGLSLMPGAAIAWGVTMTDRYYLNHFVGVDAVGIYAVGLMFAQVVEIVCSALSQAYMPHFFSLIGSRAPNLRRIVLNTYGLILANLSFALAWSLIAMLLIQQIIDPRYHAAISILPYLAVGAALNNSSGLFASIVMYKEKNLLLSFVGIVPLLVSLVLNLWWIPIHGMLGVAWAFLATAGVNMMVTFALATRVERMPWFSLKFSH